MLLSDLAAALGAPAPTTDVVVSGATHNAQWTTPGDAFVAIRGARVDGHSFAADAARLGAVAVIGEGAPDGFDSPLPYVTVPDARAALADASALLAGEPSRDLDVVGVTGTDGKTTTSWLTRYLLRAGGRRTGLLSTVGYELPDGVLRHFPEHFTTPEAPQVQELLRTMLGAGADAAVVEASSHALVLDRIRAVDWDVAIWTQLTSEHLDFHGSMEEYFAAKRRLIERAPFAVLNADDPWTEKLRGVAPEETTYGRSEGAEWRATDVAESVEGLSFTLTCPAGVFEVRLPMMGSFNVSNALAALAAVARLGVDVPAAVAALADFPGVPGRMQILSGGDIHVVVDFAHTPGSLAKALEALREVAPGELWVVVGAVGGNRDPGKRFPMGEQAARLADHAVFTEDDFRDTPLQEILAEMERGAASTGRSNYASVPDRADAIRRAILGAAPGAVVLLAGKGPEDFILRFDRSDPWDEVGEARAALEARATR